MKVLPVGTVVVLAFDGLYNAIENITYQSGDKFIIASHGADNKFGFYQMKDKYGNYMLYNIKDFGVERI